MSDLFKYASLSAKIHGMKSRMLTNEDFAQLVNMQNVSEIASYLIENTSYKDTLESINLSDVHRGQIEVLLYNSVIEDSFKIEKQLSGSNKRLFRFFYRKLEIEDVKKMIRTLQMGKTLDELDQTTLFISKYSRINFTETLAAKTVVELVESLRNTNFYAILKPLIQGNQTIDVFASEMALDLYYYQKTTKQVNKMLPGKDKELLQEFFGLDQDFKNIMWVYRAIKVYNLSREMKIRYIIPYFYKINLEILTQMIDATNENELLNIIKSTYYGKVINFDAPFIEVQFLNYMNDYIKGLMKKNEFSIAPCVGYIYIKEMEALNIINIIEGIRYKIDAQTFSNYLVGVNRRGK
jgi:V/A-type H+/Na+-transporting ATPase subunit C